MVGDDYDQLKGYNVRIVDFSAQEILVQKVKDSTVELWEIKLVEENGTSFLSPTLVSDWEK